MRSVAFFYCDNGYGHLRRILIICKYFIQNKISCTIFGNKKKIDYLANILNIKNFNIIHFVDPKFYNNFNKKKISIFKKKKINLNNFDLVLSDNLLEVLLLDKNAIIIASFFWHRCKKNNDINYFKFSEKLINKNKPIIFCTKNFSPNYLKKNKFHNINLIHKNKKPLVNNTFKTKKNILISIGSSQISIKLIKLFINELIVKYNFNKRPFDLLYVESKLLPNKYPTWIRKATYSQQMYKIITASVIRPGMGTITDSLRNSCKIFSFHESQNLEMKYNSSKLLILDYGLKCKSHEVAFNKSIEYSNNKKSITKFINLTKNIKFNGHEDIYNILSQKLKKI